MKFLASVLIAFCLLGTGVNSASAATSPTTTMVVDPGDIGH